MSIWLSSTVWTGPTRRNSSSCLLGQLGVGLGVARMAADALAHLDRHARQHPHDRRSAVGGLQSAERHATENRDDAACAAADLRRDTLEVRRLVTQHERVDALRELGVGLDDLAAELGDERLGARPEGVVDEHRLAPAAREGGSHVPRSDEPDLHYEDST